MTAAGTTAASETIDTDVVVVGAGLSGLSAAGELVRDGIDVVVLEARDRVGGRTLNHPIGDGQTVEVGGQWVGPGQNQILATARELGLETFPTFDDGRKVFWHRQRRRTYRGFTPPAAPWAMADLGQALVRLQRMSRRVSPERPWTHPRAARWDQLTLGAWVDRNTRTRYARVGMTLWSHSVLAADPAEVSLLHVLAHAAAHRGVFALASTDGGAQQDRIVGGSQRVALELARRLGDRVLTDEAVRTIEQDDGGVTVGTDRRRVRAQRVIVAASPAMSGRIRYAPALPAVRDQLTHRMVMGTVGKVIAVYPTPFWRREGLSGQALSDQGPITFAFDNSPPSGHPGVLVGFVAGAHARSFAAADPAERRDQALRCFARWFGPAARDVDEYAEKLWNDDPWSRGGYFGFFGPGGWTTFGPSLATPVGRVHWAGAETSGVCMGSMDGALRAGIRVAREVGHLMESRSVAEAMSV